VTAKSPDRAPPLRAAAIESWAETPAEIGGGLLPWLAELSRRGIKPVTKFEPVRLADAHEWMAQREFPVVRLRQRRSASECEVFLGSDERLVERAATLAGTIEQARTSVEEAPATAEIGRLLGYPGCCSDAFAHGDATTTRAHYAWAHLERRVAAPGPVAPEFNPFLRTLATMYVPCSLHCEATPALVRRELEVTAALLGADVAQGVRDAMQNPWLVLLDGEGLALELQAHDPPGEHLRYTAGRLCRGAEPFELARRADELVMDGEHLYLLKGGRQIEDLSGRAWVWWHGAVLQAQFWQRELELQHLQAHRARTAALAVEGLGPGGPASGASPQTPGPRAGSESQPQPGLAAFARLVDHASRWTAPLLPAGTTLEVQAGRPRGEVSVRLTRSPATVELLAAPALPGVACLFHVGPFAFTYPKENAVDSAAQRALVRAFASALGRFVQTELVPRPTR
jgi:hypothetical protein